MSPIAHLCACGTLIPKPGRCPNCERARNKIPHRVAHRGSRHAQLRAHVLARDGHRCVDCGTTDDLTLDHELATRCRRHNSSRAASPSDGARKEPHLQRWPQ